ncbi:hypothetical protein CYMTET_43535 [Cymbomonas tetramitiformis]|uniref:Uncharacterized protein n=1 Tax=Cymbomonas tetramitiformis TaxID=36881 RepID=A0AAE0F0G2_9CHLO|nr:hypothetical protein CYMTET_43535 [Cymbomonas tetramitiformis]
MERWSDNYGPSIVREDAPQSCLTNKGSMTSGSGLVASEDGHRLMSSAVWFDDDDDEEGEDDGVEALGCVQVRARSGDLEAPYMYTLMTYSGIISSLAADANRVLAGHLDGSLSAWQLVDGKADGEVDVGEVIGCEEVEDTDGSDDEDDEDDYDEA